ncbi:MAG TPA: ABC transporter permease [Arachnia sp.]|nr:ABC transporter permease [Arachnia sp.]HMT85683.1 ABC transporter permease [Arachnia sp.]
MATITRTLAKAGVWSAYPARTRPPTRAGRIVPPVVAAVLLLGAWWWVTATGRIDPYLLPNPLDVVSRMGDQAASGVAWRYLAPTLSAALLGSTIAVLCAIPLSFVIAHSRLLGSVLEPFVAVSQTVPLVAIAPLLVLWIGYGTVPIAVLCAIVAFFPMVTTAIVGLRQLDMRVIESALLDGAGAWQRIWHVETPIAAPAMLAGVRGGVVLSMTGAVVGEFVMGGSGLGTLLTLSRDATDIVGVFAVVAWISASALVLYGSIYAAERAAVIALQGENT